MSKIIKKRNRIILNNSLKLICYRYSEKYQITTLRSNKIFSKKYKCSLLTCTADNIWICLTCICSKTVHIPHPAHHSTAAWYHHHAMCEHMCIFRNPFNTKKTVLRITPGGGGWTWLTNEIESRRAQSVAGLRPVSPTQHQLSPSVGTLKHLRGKMHFSRHLAL